MLVALVWTPLIPRGLYGQAALNSSQWLYDTVFLRLMNVIVNCDGVCVFV